ncbi:MAG: AMP-binding protein [Deltaproteobacteria bacterium]|nr:AMP-binding protein [Deltaproteobacteria bacterium]
MILEALAHAPRATLVDARGAVSLGELFAEAEVRAAGLCARFGPLRGRRLAVFATPTRGFLVALLAIMRAGGTAVVTSTIHPAAEAGAACDRAGVLAIVAHADALEAARALSPRPIVELASLRAAGDPTPPVGSDDALLLFTSGTTAAPKGARITHDNLLAHARVLHEAWRWRPEDRLIHALPLHHLHGLGTALLTALAASATVELVPRFEPRAVLEAIASSPTPAVWMAVPTTIARVTAACDDARLRRGLAALRLVTNGSAGLPRSVSDRFFAIAGHRPLERFGMTECGVATTQPLDGRRVVGSSGFAVPGMEVRVVDEEIQVRGAGVFPGYDSSGPAARRRWGADASFDAEGWFKTGDAGALGPDGLIVHGRISVDVLKSGGYKLSALEIEAAIREHDAVDEVAVVGIPDEEWGDRVTAVIVARAEIDVDEVRAFLRERLAPYKIPKTFVLRDALPKNTIGKVTKPALIAELTHGRPTGARRGGLV